MKHALVNGGGDRLWECRTPPLCQLRAGIHCTIGLVAGFHPNFFALRMMLRRTSPELELQSSSNPESLDFRNRSAKISGSATLLDEQTSRRFWTVAIVLDAVLVQVMSA